MSNTIADIDAPKTEFSTGAVRDIQEDKGRCDLMPLWIIGKLYGNITSDIKDNFRKYAQYTPENCIERIFVLINTYIYRGDINNLINAVNSFIVYKAMVQNNISYIDNVEDEDETNKSSKINNIILNTFTTEILNLSLHFKHGCEKYGERNWEKGIPIHSFMDSGTRHLIKHIGGYTDEPHDIAFIWNIICAIHTECDIRNAELMDTPFQKTHLYLFETQPVNSKK